MSDDMWDGLSSALDVIGVRYGTVDLDHLGEIREGIIGLREDDLLDDDLYREYLGGYNFRPPEALPGARTVIIASFPHPQHLIRVRKDDSLLTLTMPPTYILYRQMERRILGVISGVLKKRGFEAVPTGKNPLPLKMLAVRSGLGEYGKNNICYVPGFGSFHRLAGFYTDLQVPEDSWREPRVMSDCENCQRCRRACPSGAIPDDRFLLRAERCITFHTERIDPFPDWFDPNWLSCLVGCMICQRACPRNRDLLDLREEALSLSGEETSLILDGCGYGELPEATRKKIEEIDMGWIMDVLPRNMRILIDNSAGKS